MAPSIVPRGGLTVRWLRPAGWLVLAGAVCYALASSASPSSLSRGPLPNTLFFAADTDPPAGALPFSTAGVDTSDTTARARDSLARRDSLLSRRRFLTPADSLRALMDSTFSDTTGEEVDTTWVVYLDSTARTEQLLHHRSDAPAADVIPRYQQSIYAPTRSPALQRLVSLDSAGQTVTIREQVNGLDVKVPVTLTLDEYIHRRYEEERMNNWRTFTRAYTIKQTRDELGSLLGNLTNIDIPVPANPLLSIFGKRGINLKISGAVDIRGAYRSSKSDQVSQYSLDVARGEPDFNQQVQINVNGTVGDKLNILADWNTQRTFEYENQLKIRYTGYDDEIVQSVEAGNVSLQTPSLIGGGQALFGIKAKFQAGPLTLTSLLSQKKGQTKEITVTGGSQSQETPIQPWQYSKSYYFVDTVYARFWERLHESQTLTITQEMQQNQIVQIDVYQSLTSNPLANQNRINANAYIDLDPLPASGRYTAEDDTLMSGRNTAAGRSYKGYFIRLDPNKDYKFVGSQAYGGYIVLNTNVTDEQAIAVRYVTAGPDGIGGTPDDVIYGPQSESDTTEGGKLLLKLVKPQFLLPSYEPAWDLQLRNVYGVGGRDLKPEGFELRVVRRVDGGSDVDQIEGHFLLEILGVDRFDGQNQPAHDNRFDFIPGLTVDLERAEIIFPTLRPFDATIREYFTGLNQQIGDEFLFPEVYDTTQNAAQYSPKNKYTIYIKSSTSVSARYPLGFNVVEGSVVVLLNGLPLIANTDYTVDYIVGEVVIRNPSALAPGANVQVKYEQNDLFQLASKTLIGARGEFDLIPNTKLGFTAMNLNQATLSDKVRLGEEPTNNLLLGVDGATSFNLPFLTDLLDALPLYRTKEMSTMRFGGELAYSSPDPNTKKSTIASDDGASIAYIDDFEGARRTVSINIAPDWWKPASAPYHTRWGDGLSAKLLADSRARLRWYNNTPQFGVVSVTDIWPNRQVRRGDEFVSVLFLDYDPDHRGMYNYSANLDSSLNREDIGTTVPQRPTGQHNNPELRRNNWNGVTQYVGQTAGSILEQNITYLEIWMQVYSATGSAASLENVRRGRLYVDLGRVNEDAIPDGFLNSEATIRTPSNPGGIPVNVLTTDNDLGLDMLSDAQEQTTYAGFMAENQGDPDINPADPSGDDNNYTTGSIDISTFNGTENNRNRVPIPNTEDLNNNGNIDVSNSYVEYAIPLDTLFYADPHEDSLFSAGTYTDSLNGLVHNGYIVGGGRDGWYQFRIPLLQASRVIGAQSERDVLQNVQYMRLWMSGFAEPIMIRVAEMGLVGNQWLGLVKDDSIVKISVVNIEDNPNYTSPPGVIRERDRTQPDQIIQGNEQSLALVLQGLPLDSSREAVKYFPTRPLDLFNYRAMKMFVHGDVVLSYFDQTNYDAEVFLRFGADTANYYEYRQPVHPGWDPLNEMNVIFSELTSIKAARDSIFKLVRIPAPSGPPGATIGIRGNPSLRQIRYMGIGVENPSLPGKTTFTPLRGEIWVNELRLVDADNAPGYAYRFDTQIKLADLGGVSFNYNRTSPTFHGLEARFGDQNNRTGWAMNANLDLSKFFPEAWSGTQIPVAYSHSESVLRPKYLPNTDVVVDEAAARASERSQAVAATGDAADSVRTRSQSLHVQDSYSLSSFRVVWPTQKWYIRDTFSKLTFGFNYNKAFDRDPAFEARRTWAWNLRISYGVSLPADLYIQPFKGLFSGLFLLDEFKDWKIYYMPIQNINAGIGAQRSMAFEQARSLNTAARQTRSFGASKNIGFAWKLTEGGLTNLTGDYSLSIDRNLLPQDNDSVGRDFSSILRSIFVGGQDSRYTQNTKFNLKPKIPNILDITKYLNLNAGYGVGYGWLNSFQKGDLGKTAATSSNLMLGVDFRLKSLVDPWFADAAAKPDKPLKTAPRDTTKPEEEKPDAGGEGKNIFGQLKMLARIFLKIPFLDYDNININFTQANRVGNNGVLGSTGFLNFWGRLPFQGSTVENGPSRLYQLGLITDPSGTLEYSPSSSFPFVGWKTIHGPRAPLAQLEDQFGQTNNLTMRTNRPLWTGATLEINWKVGWQFTKRTSFRTDSLGYQEGLAQVTTAGGVERSFLSLPPFLMLKSLRSNLEDVGKKYDRLIEEGTPQNVALAQSFEDGLEALPLLKKVFGQFVPRPNWTLRWDGIERVAGLNSVFERLTLEHAYSSTFRRDFRGALQSGGEETYAERVQYGFAPLASINATFKQFLKGNLTGNIRMNSTTTYDLNLSANNITETQAQEMVFQVTYSRRGFKLPLFGLNLSNDVDISASYSRSKNTRRLHDPSLLSASQEGTPLDGNTRTTMEPRIQYVLSARVRAALYYRYTRLAPDEGGSTTFGTTTNEAGLDLHITI